MAKGGFPFSARLLSPVLAGFVLLACQDSAVEQSASSLALVDRQSLDRRSSQAESRRCDPASNPEETVLRAYRRLARYTSTTPAPLSFEVSDFETIEERDFDTATYLDLVDLGEGWRIQVEPVLAARTSGAASGNPRQDLSTAYFASWRGVPEDPRKGLLSGKTVREVLSLSAADEPGLRQARSVTSYRITAHLQGRTKSYRAAFFWLDAPAPDGSCWIAIDELTDQVAQALREAVPLAKNPAWRRPSATPHFSEE